MPRIINVEPNISKEENEENLKQVVEVLERIAQEIANQNSTYYI